MKVQAIKYTDLTHKVIGCAMKVYKIPGNRFQEVIYQRSLALNNFGAKSLQFHRLINTKQKLNPVNP
jgi:hypothetical protein